ncbi:MAG: holo-ACP synthase [Bacteroidales bacterium]|nr:holo-ACP synthase [Bacteroidales bacterium]
MIFGIGTDIIYVETVKRELTRQSGLKQQLFTETEISYCEAKKYKYQHYAARYAAKEAFFKAIGTGWRFGMRWNEVEVVNDDLGKPEIKIHGAVKQYAQKMNLDRILLSISHIKELVNALVLIERT